MIFKKGILIPEGMGLVLAILGLVVLGVLGFKLYNLFVDQDMKNAKSFINGLNSKIENINDGERNTFALRGVQGWVLIGWNKSVPIANDSEVIGLGKDGKNRKPQKCFDKNCLCLCEDKVANCQENGYCKGIDRDVSVLSMGEARYSETAVNNNGIFSVECLLFRDSRLMEISVAKGKDLINITSSYGLVSSDDSYLSLTSKSGCNFISSNRMGHYISGPSGG